MALIKLSNQGSGGERLIRSVALLAIFGLVAWAFWINNERTIDRLNKTGSVWDETGTLTEQDKEFLYSFGKGLKDRFGMRLKVQIRKRDLEVPSLDGRTMFIGLVPSKRMSVVVFPVIMERALGRDFAQAMDRSHFQQYWTGQGWVIGLKEAAVRIWERLAEMETGVEPPNPAPQSREPLAAPAPAPESAPAPSPELTPEPLPEPAPELAPEPVHEPVQPEQETRGTLN